MHEAEVVIVGAGPAGSAAAISLARAGHQVLLVDKATFPRDKICGDGLTSLALKMLEQLGFDPLPVPNWQWVSHCVVRSPSGFTGEFPLPSDSGHFAAVVPRLDLDAALLELSRHCGAKVLENATVAAATEHADGVELTLADGERIRADWAIAADGMWSPMRKFLGANIDGYLGDWHAFRQYAHNVTGRAGRELFVSFEADLLPGYFWAFPLPGGRANIGFGVQRGEKVPITSMGALWEDLLLRPHIADALGPDVELEGSRRAWPIPARVDQVVPAARRTMFAGDALAACDVMTGEGIGQALLSGVRAAEAILEHGDSASATDAYSAIIAAELFADHRMSSLLVRAIRHRKGARIALRLAGATDWTRRNFARWLFEDYPRAIATSPRRWHRGALSGPGSYR